MPKAKMKKIKSRMGRRQVAFIGASYLFVHQAVRDMLLNGGLSDTDIVLYDIDPAPLQLEHDVIKQMITQAGSLMTVRKAASRREALKGADYVVVSVLVGGLGQAEQDDQICRKHGIRHTVGDTVGPMCTARMLRQAPLLLDIARDMEKLCPRAPLLSPTNPMAGLTTAVNRYTGVKCIGICHGTHHAMQTIAKSYGVDITDVQVNVVGVNHLGFI
ncbi:MAG TPA: alpha-glucosidase/alpha-galactosidase, partial [Planctomycetes bacterium]|nr:alpha-glucosidase/alpha-galactosidase [Planctomycetota bacterium]